jgi:uncharacterized protein
MMRYLILAIALYVLYRLVRGLLGTRREAQDPPEGATVEELVQDSQCKVYIPRRDSVQRIIEGRQYFFCSEECANRYELEIHKQQEKSS